MFDAPTVLESATGASLLLRHEAAAGPARGIVCLLHGLAEHSGRYGRFAAVLAACGFHVYAHDHRGHGGTRAPDAPPRRFAARNGGKAVLADCETVERHARLAHPGLPLVRFGHSMGGIVAANLMGRDDTPPAGVAIWNADLGSARAARFGRIALRAERALKGSDVSSALFARLTFEAWAKAVPARRSEADWLSHDADIIAAYEADPLCGFRPSVSMADDVLALAIAGSAVPSPGGDVRDLPIHLLGGGADPATANGAAVERFAKRLRAKGWRDVECVTVPGARHETLNEITAYREPAMAALTTWLDRIAP